MTSKTPLMTSAEAKCFEAARSLQREDIFDGLKATLLPRLPFYGEAMQHSVLTCLIYFLLVFLGLPLILLFWLAQLGLNLFMFPYRYYSTYFLPTDFAPPGERNIQGMHSAYAKHVNLSARRYVKCINAWSHILYGKSAANRYRLEYYLDTSLLEQSDADGKVDNNLRNSLRTAREQVSKNLGYY